LQELEQFYYGRPADQEEYPQKAKRDAGPKLRDNKKENAGEKLTRVKGRARQNVMVPQGPVRPMGPLGPQRY